MPEPFKNVFNRQLVTGMGEQLAAQWSEFDKDSFISRASAGLEELELKARSNHITAALTSFLPQNFQLSAQIIQDSLHPDEDAEISAGQTDSTGIAGWAILPLSQYVAENGQKNFTLSLNLLQELTKRFSAEFAIRYFILAKPQETLTHLELWAKDKNRHVRRLISEGTRPRLPWAMQLTSFIKDPSPILPLLEILKNDQEEYVRRSVANNLNDISKDHPDLVVEITGRWLKNASPNMEKLVRHACRSLIKAGHQKCLKNLGFGKAAVKLEQFTLLTPVVQMGEALTFEFVITSKSKKTQNLILDYVIHHQKANGTTTPKVFKWKTFRLDGEKTHRATRRHKIKPITTRTYYPGHHAVEIMVNGKSFGRANFELVIA